MQQQQSPQIPINSSLARLPQSSWARILLILVGLSFLWQLLIGSQMSIFLSVIALITIIIVANTFENLQAQIGVLQQHVFELQKQKRDEISQHSLAHESRLYSHISDGQDLQQQVDDHSTSAAKMTKIDEPTQHDENRAFASQNSTTAESLSDTLQNDANDFYENAVLTPQPSSHHRDVVDAKKVIFNSSPDQSANAPLIENNTSLKELKVMTSLWDAAINWFKGGNSIVRIAIVILLIGVVLLLRFASEYWSVTLTAKMSGIAASGFALTALGYVLRQKRFDYAISLQGAGLGIVFLVLFSSYRLGVIQAIGLSYIALIILLAFTLILAIRQNALFLAFIALGSGFVAPFILNTGSNDIPALMAYFFVLNFALAIIAYFKPWRILNTIALLMTFGIGGFAIWFNANPEQYFQISCWVWAIFALYLFISIRYSQHIVGLNTKFQDILFIDTTLIFATPFMAFSLYAGLVDSNGQALSIASAILAVIYVVMGYILHRKSHELSMLSQCFYGLGFVFTALILPFAFNAYWTSVGWAIHGIVVLYIGGRYNISSAKYFGSILLLSSGLATTYANFANNQSVLFASSLLMVTYALAAYFLKRRHTIQTDVNHGLLQVIAWIFIGLSFCLTPYVYEHTLALIGWDMYAISLPLLIWFVLLSGIYWYKDKGLISDWKIIALFLLFLTAIDSIVGQVLYEYKGWLFNIFTWHKFELALISIFWLGALSILFKLLSTESKLENIIFYRVYSTLALLFLAILGGLWSSYHAYAYFLAIHPIIVLLVSLNVQSLKFIQRYWIGNFGIVLFGLVWLYWVSITHTGQWGFSYIALFNPIDLTSILAFILITYALKPYLLSSHRELQILSAVSLLFFGLLLVSSLMLRMLHHYANLPYWSEQAWDNSVVQASLTILWASTALILTTLASRKSWRYIWMLGIAVLAIVIAKLIFLDLSHSHTLTRIISFIGSGLIMLVIGYFSPLPPKQKLENNETDVA